MEHVSSDELSHPNIVRFYKTYHSRTHLYFLMEDGGQMNLYTWLNRCNDASRLFSASTASSFTSQAVAAVYHLHVRAQICHRNIKPENCAVKDTPEGPVIKIVDFDDAMVVDTQGAMCRTRVGTIPFMAPEVALQPPYSGVCADIWSLGMLIFELLCGTRILEKILVLNAISTTASARAQNGGAERLLVENVRKMLASLSEPNAVVTLLRNHCKPEVHENLHVAENLLKSMIVVDPSQRWTAEEVDAKHASLARHIVSRDGGRHVISPPLTTAPTQRRSRKSIQCCVPSSAVHDAPRGLVPAS